MKPALTIHMQDDKRPGFCLCGEKSYTATSVYYDWTQKPDCYYCGIALDDRLKRQGQPSSNA